MSNRKGKKQPPPASLSNLLPEEKLVYHVKNSSKISTFNQLVEEHPDIDVNHLIFEDDVSEEDLDNNLGIMPIDTPLTLACRTGNLDIVKWLVEHGGDKYVVLAENTTVFHIAASKNVENLFKILLEDESDLDLNDMKNSSNETPFQISLLKHFNSTICSMCLRRGTFFNFCLKDENGRMLIHNVARGGNIKLLECLLTLGDSPLKLDEEKNTVLHHILMGSNGTVDTKVKKNMLELLNKRVKFTSTMLNAENKMGETPLWICFRSPDTFNLDIAKYLIKLGATLAHVSSVTGLGLVHTKCCEDGEFGAKVLSECFTSFKIKGNGKDSWGNTPVHYCTSERTLKLFIEKKCDLNVQNEEGYAPIAQFIVAGRLELVRMLSGEKKVNVRKVYTKIRQNLLHLIAKYGRSEMFDCFFEPAASKAPPGGTAAGGGGGGGGGGRPGSSSSERSVARGLIEEEDVNGRTPLEVAICEGCEEVAIKLVHHGANVLRPEKNLLHTAVKTGMSKLVYEMVHASEQDVSVLVSKFDPTQQRTAMHDAVERNDVLAVRALLTTSPDLDLVEKEFNSTPLMIACRAGFSEIALLLLEAKASTNFVDDRGRIALHYASGSKNVEVSRILIENGSKINFPDLKGRSPLHEACQVNNDVVVEYLLNSNADIEVMDNAGFTPLHVAVANGSVGALKKLIERKAKCHVTDKKGRTPLIVASQTRNTECGRLVIQYANRMKK